MACQYASEAGHRFADFRAGSTAEPAQCRATHGDPPSWRCWEAEHCSAALDAQQMLYADGMQADDGPCERPSHLYMFLATEGEGPAEGPRQ